MIYEYCMFFFFFFKQKTAYEMRISDWSSDVCSSDLDEQVDVCPAGDLWHAAAVGRVEVDLAADDRGEHRGATFDDRRGGLVAGGLDAEDPAPLESLAHDRPSVMVAPGSALSMAARRCAYSGVSTSLAHMTIASSFVST